jgi:TolB protein
MMRPARVAALLALVALVVAGPTGATFPGRNGKIAFVSDRTGSSQLYVMRSDGTHAVRLARSGDVAQPAWRPDGRAIVIGELRGGSREGISVVTYPSGRIRRLTAHESDTWDNSPRWSPDGTQIVFQRQTSAGTGIYVMRANGKRLRRLVSAGAYPTWSADGRWIAFVAGAPGEQQLFKVKPGGRGRAQLTHLTGSVLDPDWSPDGRRLVYIVVRDRNYDVWVARANGKAARRLTMATGQDLGPSWSPDGKRIVYGSQGSTAGKPFDLYVIHPDGSHRVRLSDTAWNESDPSWQRIAGR